MIKHRACKLNTLVKNKMKFHFLRKNKDKTWKGNYLKFYSHLLQREFEPDMQNKYNTSITPAQMKVKSCVSP